MLNLHLLTKSSRDITSAGCNALDYVLQEPEHDFAVDLNPAQNALLELKLAAIRGLECCAAIDRPGVQPSALVPPLGDVWLWKALRKPWVFNLGT